MLSLTALLVAAVKASANALPMAFDFSDLQFSTTEVQDQLAARNDAC